MKYTYSPNDSQKKLKSISFDDDSVESQNQPKFPLQFSLGRRLRIFSALILTFVTGLALTTTDCYAQGGTNPTTLYEWNLQDVGASPGERIIAYINTGTIGSYTAASFVGQIIDANDNWGHTIPTVANFKVAINMSYNSYLLEQDVITKNLMLELKSISSTQYALVANCPNGYTQLRVFLRFTNGNGPTVTMSNSSAINSTGTMLISQPTYKSAFNGKMSLNVTDNSKAATYTLAVGGKIIAEAVTVQLQSSWADYVFDRDYKLRSLQELKTYIDEYHHLPKIPTAKEIGNNGVDVGEMNKLLLQKVEELTLYLIHQNKDLHQQKREIYKIRAELNSLKKLYAKSLIK